MKKIIMTCGRNNADIKDVDCVNEEDNYDFCKERHLRNINIATIFMATHDA